MCSPCFQFYPARNLSSASSLTSGDDDEKFELIDSMIPEKIFRSDPIDIDKGNSISLGCFICDWFV